MKIIKCCLALFFFSALSLSAQTAAEMDTMLDTQSVTAAASARFVLGAADLLPAGLEGKAAETAAYDMARSRGWLSPSADEALTLEEAAYLVMGAFGIEGGVMYNLAPGPRYAYREMTYRRLIQGRSDPDMNVSGVRLLQIISRTQSYTDSTGGSP